MNRQSRRTEHEQGHHQESDGQRGRCIHLAGAGSGGRLLRGGGGARLPEGKNIDLNVTPAVAAAVTEFEFSAAAPLVEDTRTDGSQVTDTKQIDDLPINGRRFDSFRLLTPEMCNDGYFGNLSFGGMAGTALSWWTKETIPNRLSAGRTRIADCAGRGLRSSRRPPPVSGWSARRPASPSANARRAPSSAPDLPFELARSGF